MTRSEELSVAAQGYNIKTKGLWPHRTEAFVVGAQWADEHPKSPWISVKDRMPDKGAFVLISNLHIQFAVYAEDVFYPMENGRVRYDRMFANVTHWMPIPELPKED